MPAHSSVDLVAHFSILIAISKANHVYDYREYRLIRDENSPENREFVGSNIIRRIVLKHYFSEERVWKGNLGMSVIRYNNYRSYYIPKMRPKIAEVGELHRFENYKRILPFVICKNFNVKSNFSFFLFIEYFFLKLLTLKMK